MVNKSFGVKAEFIPSIPLVALGPAQVAAVDDSTNGEKIDDPQADLIQAVGHQEKLRRSCCKDSCLLDSIAQQKATAPRTQTAF